MSGVATFFIFFFALMEDAPVTAFLIFFAWLVIPT